MRLLPVGDDHERCGSAQKTSQSHGCRYRRGSDQCVPLQHVSPHPSGHPPGGHKNAGAEDVMSNNELSRRDVLGTAAAATGALVIGFWMPPRAEAQIIHPEGAAWAVDPAVEEVNAWVVVNPD